MAGKVIEQAFKPSCSLPVGANVFEVLSVADRAMREAGQRDQSEEMRNRVLKDNEADSYEAAIEIMREYVDG